MHANRTPGPRRLQPIQRAALLVSEDRVRHLPGAEVYLVAGDSENYHVIASQEGIFCPCAARTSLCAHVLAVAQLRVADTIAAPASPDELEALWRRVQAPVGEAA